MKMLAQLVLERPIYLVADEVYEHIYQAKRDLFCSLLSESRFEYVPSAGTYFQLVDYSAVSSE